MSSNRRASVLMLVALSTAALAGAQFKTVGPAPYSPAVARQRIRTLLVKIAPANEKQTITTLSGLLVWYRDIVNDELIAAWKKDTGRENLADAITELADARAAAAIVDFSWREKRDATFTLDFAPMFGNLMLRFPPSAQPFLDDLLSPNPPALSEQGQFAVCRILIDMPDVGNWNQTTLKILPKYREPAETLLQVDTAEGNRDKRIRALALRQALSAADRAAQPPQRTPLRRSISPSH